MEPGWLIGAHVVKLFCGLTFFFFAVFWHVAGLLINCLLAFFFGVRQKTNKTNKKQHAQHTKENIEENETTKQRGETTHTHTHPQHIKYRTAGKMRSGSGLLSKQHFLLGIKREALMPVFF